MDWEWGLGNVCRMEPNRADHLASVITVPVFFHLGATVKALCFLQVGKHSFPSCFMSNFIISSMLSLSPQILKYLLTSPWQKRPAPPCARSTYKEHLKNFLFPYIPSNKEKLFKYQHKASDAETLAVMKAFQGVYTNWIRAFKDHFYLKGCLWQNWFQITFRITGLFISETQREIPHLPGFSSENCNNPASHSNLGAFSHPGQGSATTKKMSNQQNRMRCLPLPANLQLSYYALVTTTLFRSLSSEYRISFQEQLLP